MGEVIHFSNEFKRVLNCSLKPHSARDGGVCFPTGVTNDAARILPSESASQWVQKLAELSGSNEFIVYDNLAFHAEVKWATLSGKRVVAEVHAQALVLTGGATVRDLLRGSHSFGEEIHYLRADFEPGNLGVALHDAVPHVHARRKHEPRFPISVTKTTPHVDFIELLHRNFFPYRWEKWADEVWMRHGRKVDWGTDGDPHARIKAAFKGDQYPTIMSSYVKPVRGWKRFLTKEKRQMCPLLWHEAYDVLGY